jgi:hypothetical protein
LATTAVGCRTAEFSDDLRVSVLPRVLADDGTRARVIIATNDPYGDPGVGRVHAVSSAGSLRAGLDLVLGDDGSVETELSCEAKVDGDCHDVITITATWVTSAGVELRSDFPVNIQTTDAFVSACAFSNRRVLKLLTGSPPVLQLAVLDTGPQTAKTAEGASFWDSASAVGAVALNLPTRGDAGITDEEQQLRSALGTVGNPLVQTFTTWDGYAAVHSVFDLDATEDLEAELSALSQALGGGGQTGLAGPAGRTGPFKAELLVVRHDLGQTGVVLALTPAAAFTEAAMFDLDDVAGGSALSFASDAPVQHCEIFTVEPGKKVDFFWVVDDSCSMQSSQTAVATVGVAASNRIQGAQLDFRAAGVSTGYYAPDFQGSYRTWTQSLTQMLSWFSPGPSSWGVGGSGRESGFLGLLSFLDAGTAATAFRSDSEVHIIFLSDTKDQSPYSADDIKAVLDRRFPKQHVVVSGIVCPEGQSCGDDREDLVGKYHTLIRETGGVLGSIKVFNPTPVTPQLQQQQADTMNRIVGTVVNGAGYALQYKPITASVRVAASGTQDARCDNRDIPRSRDDGWDLDPSSGRIAFYGKCVPTLGGTMVVSYQSWARDGTQVHETTTPVYAVGVEPSDGGAVDAGSADAGADSGTLDGGNADAGDGG